MKTTETQQEASNNLLRLARVATVFLFWILTTASYCQAGPGGITTGTQRFSTGYGMIWIDAPGDSRIVSTSSLPGFVASNIAHELDGFQLVDLEVGGRADARRYAGIWHEANAEAAGQEEAAHLFVDLSFAELEDTVLSESAAGYRLVDLEVYPSEGSLLTAAVFHPSSRGSAYALNLSEIGLANESIRQESRGRTLKDIEVYGLNGQKVYAAVWRDPGLRRSEPETTLNGSWQDLIDTAVANEGSRYLSDLELIPPLSGSNPWTAHAVWSSGAPAQHVLVPASWEEIETTHHSHSFAENPGESRNMLPVDLEIFWHYEGGIESTLPVNHGGPMVPDTQGNQGG